MEYLLNIFVIMWNGILKTLSKNIIIENTKQNQHNNIPNDNAIYHAIVFCFVLFSPKFMSKEKMFMHLHVVAIYLVLQFVGNTTLHT